MDQGERCVLGTLRGGEGGRRGSVCVRVGREVEEGFVALLVIGLPVCMCGRACVKIHS